MPDKNVTQLLAEITGGNRVAVDQVLPLVYAELKRIASRRLCSERPGHTLQATALVHEAYLQLVDQRAVHWQNRAHFFAIAAHLMRRILVGYARDQGREKRGGGMRRTQFDEGLVVANDRAAELLDIDEALTRLAALDPQHARIVELRFFGGMSVEETAEAMGISTATVKRDWRMAKAWLQREIDGAA